jgi:hypothetical protein
MRCDSCESSCYHATGLFRISTSFLVVPGLSDWNLCNFPLVIDELQGKIGFVHFFLDQINLSIATRAHLFNDVIVQGGIIHFKKV